jgi:hypothetical protein
VTARRLEVRCCCNPKKLVGWITVPNALVEVGVPLSFPLFPETGSEFRTLCMRVETINHRGASYPAIKAEDVPLEILRRVPRFEENV